MFSPASQEATGEGVSSGSRGKHYRRAAAPQLLHGLGGRGLTDLLGPDPVPSAGRSSACRRLSWGGVLRGACAAGAAGGWFFSKGAHSKVKQKQTTGCNVSSLGAAAVQLD